MERFADLLDVAVINLKEGPTEELGNGSLYTKLQQKMPQTMLAKYHQWVFEKQHQECVDTLRTFILQEAEFLTIAHETVHGMSDCHIEKQRHSWPATRTFFSGDDRSYQSCKVCQNGNHAWCLEA